MIKFLFFDYRQIESIDGFVRRLEPPRKFSPEPLLTSQQLWGLDYMTTYGSVVRRPGDGLFQMWYSSSVPKKGLVLAYAESRDGILWERPVFDIMRVRGKKTNIVFEKEPHGAAVIYDEADPRPGWKYKMLTGASPSGRISSFRSDDGIHWLPAAENPVVGSNPDCPISFCRMPDGRIVAFHRPGFADRRVGRTETWNFRNFSEAVVVMEPDQSDPPNIQFYGLGSAVYGAYVIGTLWIYHTDVESMDFYKMTGYQEPEFVHSRGSYCWHRTAQGVPWIKVEEDKKRFDSGQVQPVSAPVFLDNEVRFYYTGQRTRHGAKEAWTRKDVSRGGIGMASCKPDRFVGVTARNEGRILTRPFWTATPRFWINANIRRGGWLRAELIEIDGKPIPGFGIKDSVPMVGDSTRQELTWKGAPDMAPLANREIRMRLHAKNTTLYSVAAGSSDEVRRYWDFRIAGFIRMDGEKQRM